MSSLPRILITGAGGFVGPHVVNALRGVYGDAVSILGTGLQKRDDPTGYPIVELDVTDQAAVRRAVARYRPTHVLNLAAIAAPAAVSESPDAGWRVHLDATRHIANAILDEVPECVLVHVGSGLVYGDSARSGLPLDENTVLAPVDEYGASKAAADLALGVFVAKGMHCIRLRPFNHTGPGQTDAFVIPAFAMQIAQIEAGLMPPVMRVGNLEAQRDFLDVRDVADAYVRAIQRSSVLESGLILNVASGIPRKISDVLELLLSKTKVHIEVEIDTARAQGSVFSIVVGNADKARQLLNWAPEHEFQRTVSDVLNDCRSRLAWT
ncbi:NAD-dependent epimerase/dehydratase family protein [Tardiphaga sp. vice304]|uniref:NAD-dependent epimerase/dehydratase family protein n=1 Tax=Tardiphaga sp. vice304 TaxID=2592817 RepID=UPI001165A569|nr:NAD-dependent epimerase/dehydratase family protein [Tardiphaga sp. vice304]QDM28180.1 NAD-dependent epimerase/dehydratase family protein [Tardiphaga sp. vice304]